MLTIDKKQYIIYTISTMRMLIAITVYDVDGVCEELAKRTHWPHRYSRQRINALIKNKILEKQMPPPEKIGRQYLLTEAQLAWLAEGLEIKKRPKSIDKKL
jgi:hypothetical protein